MPPGGALFKGEWLKRYKTPPQPHQVQGIFQSWDTAYDIQEHNDFSVCSTWALSGQNCYLLDVYRAKLTFPDLEKAIYAKRKEWEAGLVIVEKAGSGFSVGQNIRRADHRNVWLQAIPPVSSKQDRASQQTPKFERGEIFLPEGAPWLRTFEDELLAFPNGKHDDQVDSVIQFLAAVDTGNLVRFADAARRR
nr:phage terminase large subunit [Alteraurantiacibacter buctensis]